MALNRLSEKLIDFGFTKEEAEVYVFLSSMGPSPARVISRRFDIHGLPKSAGRFGVLEPDMTSSATSARCLPTAGLTQDRSNLHRRIFHRVNQQYRDADLGQYRFRFLEVSGEVLDQISHGFALGGIELNLQQAIGQDKAAAFERCNLARVIEQSGQHIVVLRHSSQ